MSEKGYRQATDSEIRSCFLVSANGRIIPIDTLVEEVNIFQNIFQEFQQCEIILKDATGLFATFEGSGNNFGGFTGTELLFISYRTKSEDLPFRNAVFVLYEIDGRTKVKERSELYTISGISLEAMECASLKVSKTYGHPSGRRISDMVKNIIDEYVYTEKVQSFYDSYQSALNHTVEKTVTIDPTDGLHKFIMPNFRIEDMLRFLAKEADNENHIPCFMFYENAEGFNFRDMEKLVSQDVKSTYSYTPSNFETKDDPEFGDAKRIQDYEVLSQNDYMKKIQVGTFRAKTINIDTLRKTKLEVDFKYQDNISRFTRLNEPDVLGRVETGIPVVDLVTTRRFHDTDPVMSKEGHLPKRINNFSSISHSYKTQIFNTVLALTVPGDSEVMVGDVIYISMPIASDMKDYNGEEDKTLSGKYLVTKVRHKISGGRTGDPFITTIECTKDTGPKP